MKPKAIIVDMDGTLCHINKNMENPRKYYDSKRVGEDIIDDSVSVMVNSMSMCNINIIILTGREDVNNCAKLTEKWLFDNCVKYDLLLLREHKDHRPGEIVKKELYEKYVKPFYDVLFAIDDMQKIIDMWNSIGIKTLKV